VTPARDGLLVALGRETIATRHGSFVVHRFQDCALGAPTLAVALGDVTADEPLPARVHSSCVTSEAFGACDCDCAEQLDAALAHVAAAGRGILFYLMQEGRGAGFLAKALDRMLVQASGHRLTTFGAYGELGLPDDRRSYGEVAAMARLLGVRAPLRLLSNNPEKVAALRAAGVRIAATEPIRVPASAYSQHYLDAKAAAGHELGDAAYAGAATLPERVRAEAPEALAASSRFTHVASYMLPVRTAGATAWFRLHAYVDGVTGRERIVLTYGSGGGAALVRLQRTALLDRFPLVAPRFRHGWDDAVARIVAHGSGVVLFAGADEDVRGIAEPLFAAHLGGRRGVALDDGAEDESVRALLPRAESAAAGVRLLRERLGEIPAALARTAARGVPDLRLGERPVRRIVATGVGSSSAHAALLAHLLRAAGRDAVAEPLSSFLGPSPATPDDVLVVFSQGLSPNARLALETVEGWRRTVLVTAVTDAARLDPLRARGVVVHTIDGEGEFGTLVRVIGPTTGYWAALALAAALGGPAAPHVEPVLDALARLTIPTLTAEQLERPLALVTSGAYGGLAVNLQYKMMEGALLPMPPVWDVLHLAHGPFQQRFETPATFLALTRAGAAGEDELLDRLATMLVPERHVLVRLPASLPGVLALFEHEALLNGLVLAYVEARGVDQMDWPGRGRDAPLYGYERPAAERRLARVAWPDLATTRPRVAIVPLGATEQHGPHLPFSTDTLIAEALAMRLAARLEGAVALPALPVGCSSEHMGFPGTLDVSPGTLVSWLSGVLASLARHGVGRAIVFSAHGGNVATLQDAAAQLAAAVPAMSVDVLADLDALTARLQAEAARFGIAAEAAGHHAGEVETSIMLALHPELVRMEAAMPGHVEPAADPQSLFYPDLRRTAPTGTVGDPRGACALRGMRYVAAWVDVLEAACVEKKRK
jgi:3,4-dihydroxy 2-butanone 4-phosphate synthase / GTP cyclohydrolase II